MDFTRGPKDELPEPYKAWWNDFHKEREEREEVKRLADIFRGRIIDVTNSTYTIELTGPGGKLDAFIEALQGAEVVEAVRSGVSGISRGDRALR